MALTFKNAPETPYYAVIFFAELTETDRDQYKETGDRMLALAREQPGFLGYDDLCASGDYSFNVSYWDSLDAIDNWKNHPDHLPAQVLGKEQMVPVV